jgi:hypothetical protein
VVLAVRRSLGAELTRARARRQLDAESHVKERQANQGEVIVVLEATEVPKTGAPGEEPAGYRWEPLAELQGEARLDVLAGASEALRSLRMPGGGMGIGTKRAPTAVAAADERATVALHAPVPSSELDPLLADWFEVIDFNHCCLDSERE